MGVIAWLDVGERETWLHCTLFFSGAQW